MSANAERVPEVEMSDGLWPMERLKRLEADPGAMTVILQRVAGGETLRKVGKSLGLPHGPLLLWLMEDDARWVVYRRALVLGGFAESDEAMDILDCSTPEKISVDKERANVRKWRASKNANEYFGERVEVMHHRALPSEEALMAQLDAMISSRPELLDALMARRARLAAPVAQAEDAVVLPRQQGEAAPVVTHDLI